MSSIQNNPNDPDWTALRWAWMCGGPPGLGPLLGAPLDTLSYSDPVKIAEELEKDGVNAIVVTLSVGEGPAVEKRHWQQVKLLVEELHKRDMTVFAYVKSNTAFGSFFDEYPEALNWMQRTSEGEMIKALCDLPEVKRYAMCSNQDGWRDKYCKAITKTGIDMGIDGFFYDNIGFCVKTCYCDECKRRFREHSQEKMGKAHDLPTVEDWEDPVWREWLRFRYESVIKFLKNIYTYGQAYAKEKGRKVAFQTHAQAAGLEGIPAGFRLAAESWPTLFDVEDFNKEGFNVLGFQEQALYPPAAHPGAIPSATRNAITDYKIYQGCTPGLHVTNLASSWGWARLPDPEVAHEHDVTQETIPLYPSIMRYWWSVLAAFGGPSTLGALWGLITNLASEDNVEARKAYRECNTFGKKYLEYYVNTESFANIALYHSLPTLMWYGAAENYLGFQEALIDLHINYDVIAGQKLSEKRLSQYKTLILPNVACLSDKEVRTLREFVSNGGSIVATGETSLYDENGRKRGNYALSDLFGVRYGEAMTERINNKFGGGQVVFFPGTIDKDCWKYHRVAFRPLLDAYVRSSWVWYRAMYIMTNAVRDVTGCLPIEVEAPLTVAFNAYKQRNRFVTHLLNFHMRPDKDYAIPPARDIRVSIRLPEAASAARSFMLSPDMESPMQLDHETEDGCVRVQVPELQVYGIVVIEIKAVRGGS